MASADGSPGRLGVHERPPSGSGEAAGNRRASDRCAAPIALFGVDWMRPGEDAAYRNVPQPVDRLGTAVFRARAPVIAEYRPDVMVCDALNFAAHIAAQNERIRTWAWIRICSPWVPDPSTPGSIARSRGSSRRGTRCSRATARVGVRFRRGNCAEAQHRVYDTRVRGRPHRDSSEHAPRGSPLPLESLDLSPGFPIEQIPNDWPLVYMSLGTLFWRHRPALFGIVAQAASELGVES